MNYEQIRHSEPMRGALDGVGRAARRPNTTVCSPRRPSLARSTKPGIDSTAQATIIPPFFPTLVERFARDQLRAAAQVQGLVTKQLPEVLFVCVAQRRPQPDGRSDRASPR